MKNPMMVLAVIAILATAPAAHADEGQRARAMEASQELMEQLKGALMQAVKEKGFAGAVETCSAQGPAIPQEVAAGYKGLEIGRVSLKYRNPANRPDDFETAMLKKMDEDNRAGDLKPYYEGTDTREGETVYRFMKPLKTGGLCLNCHGTAEDMDPAAAAKIKAIYPKDKATGYSEGMVRGAVTVTIAE